MVKALQDGTVPFAAHLEACKSCRETFALLRHGAAPGAASFEVPDAAALDRFAAIPLAFDSTRPAVRRSGTVAFDSWREQGAVAIRDIGIGDVRRLVLQAGAVSLEIVAEQRPDGWEFVARVYHNKEISSAWALQAGRTNLLPGVQGFYRWRSKRGPRALTLRSPEQEILFDNLSWL